MANDIFLTGATGFLGTEIALKLVEQSDRKIYCLVRAKDEAEAFHRLRSAWNGFDLLYEKIKEQMIPVVGDFTKDNLGLSQENSKLIRENVRFIIHAGAEVGVQNSASLLEKINLTGTKNMVDFAAEIPGLKHFTYVSTAYVAGQSKGLILENGPLTGVFSTYYEKTKGLAEELVKNSKLPYSICRPGMIVGNSKSGWIKSFNTVYYLMKLVMTGKLRVIPVKSAMKLNLVPVDYVADAIVRVSQNDNALGKVYHLTCPDDKAPNAGELVEYLRQWADTNLSIKLPRILFINIPGLKKAGLSYNSKKDGKEKKVSTNLLALAPYFNGDKAFDRTNTDVLVGFYDIDWRMYIDTLLEFACRKNFMHQTERSVFEQAMVRRDSKKYPVNYYDVAADGIKKVTGPEANARIEKIVDALLSSGIKAGDKVAMTGINSVDYMTLDQAIGLIGATSVPIYYTTPIQEVKLLLERSGSAWFFVGDERIMDNIEEIDSSVKVVAFSNGLNRVKTNVIVWDDFLANAIGRNIEKKPDPRDLATIRYTSGTTGDPKGVMFNFAQLAWMGEVLTNLLTWKDRNLRMRYLSFLPQSHVVEGILASYAPYYMLAEIDYYYLNDFGALVESLPKVRPTVFFSVPRFYEKLWDQLAANRVGKLYMSMKSGFLKKALGLLLKKVILKKAGLDACGQLIVGSAPMSEKLLNDFRELGIEIHNAYGQTEAPLITINRNGDNVIPSIGTSLPDTKVTVEKDGELIVEGPQVCLGYYGMNVDTIKDGVLKSGDLGSIDECGHIYLEGRKKDMIITAYGKNISIPKIEERLKNIAGVSEAVLIGENKPYCTALIWMEGENNHLSADIDAVNANLSHPEQIKKYKVIAEPLSIQKGELTPNLKVKRGNVVAHYADEIEEMYV